MSRRFIWLTLPVFIVLVTTTQAQQKLKLESMLPPAPNAAELGKYGTYPVGMLTGVPEIDFSLYEINTGKLKLPVKLSYHASGIKLNQRATDVGLGWTLMAGASISRTVYGSPDDKPYGYFNYTPPSVQDLWSITDYNTWVQYASNPGNDLEPDLFVFNLAGKSGKFICGKNKEFYTIPFVPIKIQKVLDGQNKVMFQITDDDGTIYQFYNYTTTMSETTGSNYIRLNTSNWYLTRMISSDYSDTIAFVYDNYAIEDVTVQQSWPVGKGISAAQGCTEPIVRLDGPLQTIQTTVNAGELQVKEIIFRGGKIKINRNNIREDLLTTSKSLDEIVVYNSNDQVIKKFVFSYDYFRTYANTTDFQSKRLKLLGFSEYGADNLAPKTHSFGYDETPVPTIGTYGQDYWGFYNGQNNQGLIPYQQVMGYALKNIRFNDGLTYSEDHMDDTYWTFGNANREPSAAHMQAGMLKRITYPTGGKTMFEYEPHKYTSDEYVKQSIVKGGRKVGIDKYTKSEGVYAFSYPSNLALASINSHILANMVIKFSVTNMGNSVIDGPQIVTITDQTTNLTQTYTHTGDLTIEQTQNIKYMLVPGHSYVLTVTNYGDPATFADCDLRFDENTGTHDVKFGGGLRVKSIKSYNEDDQLQKEEKYVYGVNEDGLGTKLFDEAHFYKNYEDVVDEQYWGSMECYHTDPGGPDVCLDFHALRRDYLGISQYSSMNYLGSPVLYPSVTKYEGSETLNIGKTVYEYNIVIDRPFIPAEFVNSGNYGTINNAWNQGDLVSQTVYKNENNIYTPVTKDTYEYTWFTKGLETAIQTKQYKTISRQGCGPVNTIGNRLGLGHFSLFQYNINTGASRRSKETKTVYAQQGGGVLQTVTTTQYLNPGHLYPSVVSTGLSDGSQKIIKYYYPPDLATGNSGDMYQKLTQQNVLSKQVRTEAYNNTQLLTADQIVYSNTFSSNGEQVLPLSHTKYDKSNTAVEALNYSKYDQYGNALERELNGDLYTNLYDYKSAYPVCEVKNATNSDIAYTSFEADGTGNWVIGGSARNAGGITGSLSYQLQNGSITRSGLNAGTTYIISYWIAGSNPLSIAGTQGAAIQGKYVNGYIYFEHKITGVTQVELPAVAAVIDELRLYPEAAQMTTNTYKPLIGVSSTCTSDNTITYYEYDAKGRLQLVKDQYGNVIKAIEYHYKGQ